MTQDIVRTYRAPRRVVRKLYDMGPREDLAIMWLLTACFIIFLSNLPALQRAAVLGDGEFQRDVVYALMSWLMLWPLMFYVIAFLAFLLTYAIRRAVTSYGARLAIFWGLLASTPIGLFYGLLSGFNGTDHPGTVMIGAVWLIVLFWFWISGLIEVSKVK